jgi:hypothetical protein
MQQPTQTAGGWEMHTVKWNHIGIAALVAMVWAVVGCAGSADSEVTNLNGVWQNPSNQQKVVINFAGEKNTISVGEKTLAVTLKPFEVDSYMLKVSDAASGEKNWKIFRIWDDTGKNFTLKFEHDGRTENLERVKG